MNKKHKAQSVGDLIAQFIQGTELEKSLLERQVVQIHSAALRQQLFECRYDVIKKLNQAINAQFIKDIRILG